MRKTYYFFQTDEYATCLQEPQTYAVALQQSESIVIPPPGSADISVTVPAPSL